MHTPFQFLTLRMLITCFVFTIPTPGYTATTPVERHNLHGVTTVALAIAPLPDWAEQGNTTKPVLRNLVQHELDAAKITTADIAPDDGGTLEVVVTGIRFPDLHLYAYTCHMKFYQRVRLLSDKSLSLAITWNDESFGGSLDGNKSATAMQDSVTTSVGHFITDYLAANPPNSRPMPKPKKGADESSTPSHAASARS